MNVCLQDWYSQPSDNDEFLRFCDLSFNVDTALAFFYRFFLTFDVDSSVLFLHIKVMQGGRTRGIFDITCADVEARYAG